MLFFDEKYAILVYTKDLTKIFGGEHMRKRILKTYLAIFAIGIPYLIWVLLTDLRIPCLFYEITGLLCPGCGITRMFASIARFEFEKAFMYNGLCFILVIAWNIIALLCATEKIKWVQSPKFQYSFFALTVVSLFVFGVLRNIF